MEKEKFEREMDERNQTTRLITNRWDKVELREPTGGGMAGREVVEKVKNDYLKDPSSTSI